MPRLILFLLLTLCAWAQPQAPVDVTSHQGQEVVADFARSSLWFGAQEKSLDFAPWQVLSTPKQLLVLDLLGGRLGSYQDEFHPWPARLEAPSGLAYKDGRIYVVERSGRLLELTEKGEVRATLIRHLEGAEGLAATSDRLFISFPRRGQVRSWDLERGDWGESWDDLELPTRLASDGRSLWVAESGSGYLWEFELDGQKRRRLESENQPGLLGLCRHQGRTLTTNPLSRVCGSLRFELEDRLFAGGFSPVELGQEYQVVHAPLLELLFQPQPLFGYVDADLDSEGNAYYTVSGGGRVVRARAGSFETLAEGLDDPGGLLFAAGYLWVAETGAGKVWRISLDGRKQLVHDKLSRPVDLDTHPTLGLMVLTPERLVAGSGVLIVDKLTEASAVETLPDGRVAILERDRVRLMHPLSGESRLFELPQGSTKAPSLGWRVGGGLVWDPVRNRLFVCLAALGEIREIPLGP